MDTDMGERQSEGGVPGRRRVHPDDSRIEALLARTMSRPDTLDAEAEQRAVAAFRDARDAGAHRARTRRRDDWRPRESRRARRSLRATLTLSLAGLALGGVAFAAIGSAGGSSDDGHAARQRTHAPVVPSTTAPRTPAGSVTPVRPDSAKDTEAHCRAYEKKLTGKGKALESTAWQRLVAAAGGEAKVTAYCARQLGQPIPGRTSAEPEKSKMPKKAKETQQAQKPEKQDK
jgi:hypothetical protein